MELTGVVKVVGNEQVISASYKKRELVIIQEDDKYPQFIAIEFPQDKGDLLNGIKVNDNVTVSVNLGGREWINPQGEAKYFNSIKGWKIVKNGSEPKKVEESETDDMPF